MCVEFLKFCNEQRKNYSVRGKCKRVQERNVNSANVQVSKPFHAIIDQSYSYTCVFVAHSVYERRLFFGTLID